MSGLDPARPDHLEWILEAGRVSPKRSFGQHFLVDPGLRDAVFEALQIGPADQVLEVGPGPGTLTVRLAPACARLVAVELDHRLARELRRRFRDRPQVEVVEADILKVDLGGLFPAGGEVVCGNIPYYLTGALVRRLLDLPPRPRRIGFVVQREVARRWAGLDGWSLATVAVQAWAEVRVAFELPAVAFQPPPKVASALVLLDLRPAPAVDVPDLDAFLRLVESVFQFRRKQLRPGLARATGLPAAEVGERLAGAGIDPARRPETLDLGEWERLARALMRPAPTAG